MATTNSVNHAISTNINAPVLNDAWGALTAILDAVLVNGYSVQSIVSISSNLSGEITANFGTSHGYNVGQILSISGATNNIFNGRFRIKSIVGNSVIFKETISASQTTTGTISAKVAPFGYSIYYSSTNKRVYKSLNPANAIYYIVDDALWSGYTTSYSKVAGVGLATNVNQSTGEISGIQSPYDAANPNKNWIVSGSGSSAIRGWAKWVYKTWTLQDNNGYLTQSSGGNSTWHIVGNDEFFYLALGAVPPGDVSVPQLLYGAGKYTAQDPDNTTNYFLSANVDLVNVGAYRSVRSSLGTPDSYMPSRLLADAAGTNTGTAYAYTIMPTSPQNLTAASARSTNSIMTYANSEFVDLSPVYLFSYFDNKIVGRYANMYAPFGSQNTSAANSGKVVNINNEQYVLMSYFASGTPSSTSQALLYIKLKD